MLEKYSSPLSYIGGIVTTAIGIFTLEQWVILIGIVCTVITCMANWYYKRKEYCLKCATSEGCHDKDTEKIVMATGGSALFLASSIITHFEGLRLKPYFDGASVLSVCYDYGHTGNEIERNRTYTKAECDKLLDDDLNAVKRYVDPLIKSDINTLTQAAIYSFVYNVGMGELKKSTLLKKSIPMTKRVLVMR